MDVGQVLDVLVRLIAPTQECIAECGLLVPFIRKVLLFVRRVAYPPRSATLVDVVFHALHYTNRLVYAAYLFEQPDTLVLDVAKRLAFSPQSFGRNVKMTLGMTTTEMREEYTGRTLVKDYIDRLIAPNKRTLLLVRSTTHSLTCSWMKLLVGAAHSAAAR